MATQGDPRYNKNYRGNPSLVISHFNNDDEDDDNASNDQMPSSSVRNIVIDVGKTFRENAIRFLHKNDVHSIDA
eukprot:3491600-Ditylum_brightwellii.AAC.1